jgi:hypothetical protein
MKIHILSLLNASAEIVLMSASGSIGAQPTHCSLVRQTTQPGLHSWPGTQIQPMAASCAQRP